MADLKDDIEKYLKGQLGHEERHALEKKALSDPFLFDALGGAESIGANEFLEAVRGLDRRTSGKREIRIPPAGWQIAAGVALLVGASYVLYTSFGSNDPGTLAQKASQEEDATSANESAAKNAVTDSSLSTQEKAKEKLLSLSPAVTSQPDGEARKKATPAEELSKPGTAATEPKDSQGASGAAVERADSDQPKADKIAATEARERAATADNVPAGQAKVNAQLPADKTALSEVVVLGYDNSKKEEGDKPEEPIQLAEPAGGKRAYNKYLDDNLHYPPAALDQKIEGTVTLEFTVQPNGAIEDFNLIRGLEGGCNEEVIRLVKEGPAWSPSLRGIVPLKSTVRVRVKFDLPK